MLSLRKATKHALAQKFESEKAKEIEKSFLTLAKKKSKSNGTDISDEYKTICYQRISHFLSCKDDEVDVLLQEVTDDTCENTWDSVIFDKSKKKQEKQFSVVMFKPKAIKGVHKCKCGCDEFFMWSQQDRCGDESLTHYRQCINCGQRKKE